MELIDALVLGILQGVTEWLPVSSSGHLIIGQEMLGLPAEENLLFDLMVHLGTVLAVCVYFRRELWRIVHAMVPRSQCGPERDQLRLLGAMIAVGTVPVAVVGVLVSGEIEDVFTLQMVGVALLVNAAVLVAAERIASDRRASVRLLDAIVIGVFQAVAIIPGISRSGFAISGGLMRGVERETVATFAFLLSVPALLGAVAYGFLALERYDAEIATMLIGMIAAFVVGIASIDALLRAVRAGGLWAFGVYCAVVGTAVTVWSLL
ncbi:MAG: undecaprenyl-diphosphate phosphatase [Methanobacteriota archaeon]|nr:MAG: undecaprenyl-diphosphate phosphatase [Euryarchaeota archaeon]